VTGAALALARLREAGAQVFCVPDGRVRFEAAAPLPAALLAEARRHRDEIARLLTSPVPLGEPPVIPCTVCNGRLWLRLSVLSGGPGPWQCARCDPLPPDVWPDATAIPASAGCGGAT
jgi:hypothetical protein